MQKHMYRPTTFFPSNYVPVNIVDEEESTNFQDPSTYRKSHASRRDSFSSNMRYRADGETVIVDEHSDSETSAMPNKEKIVQWLKRAKQDKLKSYPDDQQNSEHIGYEVRIELKYTLMTFY